MLSRVELLPGMRILETGSGRGAFTREILRRMPLSASLDICEIKTEYNAFIEPLVESCPGHQVTLHNRCVVELLEQSPPYDVIISSLPLLSFQRMKDNKQFLHRVLTAYREGLKPGGHYLQYQYFRSNKCDIEKVFGKPMLREGFVPFNLPPAFIYHMQR